MILITCAFCNKDFEVKPSRLQNNSFLCCSTECSGNFRKKEKIPNVVCWACGKDFWIGEHHLKVRKNPERICCSIECSKLERSDRFSGDGNHQFGLKGELNSSYKSDIQITNYGYVKIRCHTHPLSDVGGYVLFHRALYEEFLKDSHQFDLLVKIDDQLVLPRDIIVHHLDENKLNNSISNLTIITLEEHTSYHKKNPCGKVLSGELCKTHDLDAGQDVFSAESKSIAAGSSSVFRTGLRVEVPENYVGLLWSRSGLSVKHRIEVGAGCVDSGYTGEILVHLYNHGKEDFYVEENTRIAQFLTIPVNINRYIEVATLSNSSRGENGFGSTGHR